ncbi:hypothetical protein V2J09_002951 [Rumex salicifolius]
MAKNPPARRELLERWRAIEEEEEEDADDVDSSNFDRLHAYNLMICLPKDNHIWCGCWEIMGPFLETFYNYFKVESCDSPLKVLWERTCQEMRKCTQCISQNHRAQEMYSTDYESSVVSPLLIILKILDEDRVSQHLKEFNVQIKKGNYDPERDSSEVISLMFEVLTFPVLLDDKFVATDFQTFIEAVDNVHELSFAKQQHFPGVYGLLFLNNRRTRSIGLRLAGNMEKVRCGVELEPLQPLLKKYISFLATEVNPTQSSSEYARPRLELDRMTAWIGIKALLGFLEPAALEEGILEKYPVFLNFILDHISDDSPEFSHAVNCMRQLFEILGYKLWLRTSLPPSVIRDSLLSQCFHTRSEKIHKDIFDLFYPFLVSLEALQDGELEKQRRHIIYFFLHQVTRSSNFGGLMREKARQIALLIVHRGYKMNPPCPPSECAHMGPSLVSSIKDTRLHNSLRQPALDLIETIIVSEAAALISSAIHSQVGLSAEYDDTFPYGLVSEDKDLSCWNEFNAQCNAIHQEHTEWLCVPMIWLDVLVEIDPLVLPVSFSKAVAWALSRFSLLEPENAEMSLPVKSWLATKVMEVSVYFGWRCPTGSDDGGDCKESKNSVRVSTMCFALIRTFKRLAAHFTIRMEVGEVWKNWTWEARMAESLILLLADPNDNVRQFGRRTLENISKTRGLACGLHFLCSSEGSLSATFLGLRHALVLVQLDPVLTNYQALHHFFFVLYKVFREGFSTAENLPEHSTNELNTKFSSQGGFLQQPTFTPLSVPDDGLQKVLKRSWESFCHELAKAAWPSVQKCLQKGKKFMDCKVSQMTSVRVLEIIPIVLANLATSPYGQRDIYRKITDNASNISWLHDLVVWGKSSLQIIVRYWKQSIISIFDILKASLSDNSSGIIIFTMEKIVSCDAVSVESLVQQVLQLSVSLSANQSHTADKSWPRSRDTLSENFEKLESKNKLDNLVVLSDDDSGSQDESHRDILAMHDDRDSQSKLVEQSFPKISNPRASESHMERVASGQSSLAEVDGKASCSTASLKKSSETLTKKAPNGVETLTSKSGPTKGIQAPAPSMKPSSTDNKKKELKSKSRSETINRRADNVPNLASSRNDAILKAIVHNSEDDPLEQALKSVPRKTSILIKQSSIVPKRQVIQLGVPGESRSGYMQKQELRARRFKPPRLEEWFRRILELDFFFLVGLSSDSDDENKTSELKQVPITFDSSEQYVDIFRPLVLEEFKAQLRSSFQELSALEEMSCGSISVVSVERVDDFNLVRCVHDASDASASSSCSENDLVLLTKQPLQKSPHTIHLLGKVERREMDNKRRSNLLVIRVYIQGGSSRLNRARKLLLERSKWFLGRVTSITSQLREFQALTSSNTIPALPIILRPSDQSHLHEPRCSDLRKLPQAMQRVLQSTFNDSQLQAIGSVLKSSDSEDAVDLSLVQGPPGTGKTRTIVAIISAFLAMHSPSSNIAEKQLSSKMKPDTSLRARLSNSVAIARAWQDAALARQLNDEAEKDNKAPKALSRRRVLVCAQSNAAVDELVSRLAGEGIYGANGEMHRPYIVRVGNAKTVHANSIPFFIDTLVENRLSEEKRKINDGKNTMSADSSAIRSSLEKVVDRIRYYESKRANLKDVGSETKNDKANEISDMDNGNELSDAELGAKLRILYQQKKEIYVKLGAAQAEEKKSYEDIKALRTKLRRSILKEAEIVVATLSGCGGDLQSVCSESASTSRMAHTFEQNLFDAVVVDEAAQALEPATLIPLQLLKSSGTKCIMVGDPKQLPATVLSNVASKYFYQCSMFERLQRAGHPVIMLTKQYRMHPEISYFPSVHFYDGKLLNGIQMSSKRAPFHETEALGPYVFYDVVDGQEMHGRNSGSSSLCNEGEANAAVETLKYFKSRYPSEFTGGRIGIITPYKSQLSLLRSRFSNEFGSSVTSDMEFNTVDGFQGREVDILLLSTVRSSSADFKQNHRNIGFVADVRRMNVALTRARLSLWIFGNSRTLKTNNDWAALVKDASQRNLVVPVEYPYKSMFKMTAGKFPENSGNPSSKVSSVKGDRLHHGIHKESSSHQTHEGKSGCNSIQAPIKKRRHEGDTRKKERRGDTDDQGKDHSGKKTSLDGHFNELTLENADKMNVEGERSRQMDQPTKGKSNSGKKLSPDPSLSPQHPKRKKSKYNSSSLDKGKSVCKDADNKDQAPSEADPSKSLISKRKQQRDAVNALLSSALISSKKSERKPPSHSSSDINFKLKKSKK